jgi:hypothetical protein
MRKSSMRVRTTFTDKITVAPEDKLKLLRRLDRFRTWRSTTQRRLCLGCGKLISGAEIRICRSMWGLGLVRLRCPSKECKAGPMDWVEPDGRT